VGLDGQQASTNARWHHMLKTNPTAPFLFSVDFRRGRGVFYLRAPTALPFTRQVCLPTFVLLSSLQKDNKTKKFLILGAQR
jgi:hypothetical protein